MMLHYLTNTGGYYVGDRVSPHDVECAAKPSIDHVLNSNWQTDPKNTEVCWRPKTAQELDAEKQEKADNLVDYKIALKALAQVTWNSVPELKTAFPTYQEFQAAIVSRYKVLLP